MAPTNPTDHELNAVLARVCGIEIEEETILDGNFCRAKIWVHDLSIWNPLHDANQIERVEEWLEKHKPQRFTWTMKFINSGISEPRYGVMLERFDDELCEHKNWYAENTDKKRAFALAIWQMECANDPRDAV